MLARNLGKTFNYSSNSCVAPMWEGKGHTDARPSSTYAEGTGSFYEQETTTTVSVSRQRVKDKERLCSKHFVFSSLSESILQETNPFLVHMPISLERLHSCKYGKTCAGNVRILCNCHHFISLDGRQRFGPPDPAVTTAASQKRKLSFVGAFNRTTIRYCGRDHHPSHQ